MKLKLRGTWNLFWQVSKKIIILIMSPPMPCYFLNDYTLSSDFFSFNDSGLLWISSLLLHAFPTVYYFLKVIPSRPFWSNPSRFAFVPVPNFSLATAKVGTGSIPSPPIPFVRGASGAALAIGFLCRWWPAMVVGRSQGHILNCVNLNLWLISYVCVVLRKECWHCDLSASPVNSLASAPTKIIR